MLEKLDGYDVTAAELDKFIAGLTVPAFDVEVIKRENIYEVYCNCKLLYYYESKVTADQEKKRIEDNWFISQAQIHFADKKIVQAEPEPFEPISNDMVVLEGIAANYEQTLLLQDSVTAVMLGLADLYELNLGG